MPADSWRTEQAADPLVGTEQGDVRIASANCCSLVAAWPRLDPGVDDTQSDTDVSPRQETAPGVSVFDVHIDGACVADDDG